jgi:hypothetical protein
MFVFSFSARLRRLFSTLVLNPFFYLPGVNQFAILAADEINAVELARQSTSAERKDACVEVLTTTLFLMLTEPPSPRPRVCMVGTKPSDPSDRGYCQSTSNTGERHAWGSLMRSALFPIASGIPLRN